MTHSTRVRRAERGQSMVEFALVLPLFLLLMLGMIDFGRLLFSYISLSNGAREMARVAAISSNTVANAPIDAFKNLTVFGGPMDPNTDSVVVTVYQQNGTAQGSSTCALPLVYPSAPGGCSLPATGGSTDGWVDVSVTYVFHFNPLFENRLAGVVDVSLLQPISRLTSTVRTYIE